MSEFFERLERKKRLKIKCDKKDKRFNNKERKNRENVKIKYRKQYLEHMQDSDKEESAEEIM